MLINLQSRSPIPLYRQVFEALRRAIIDGDLSRDERLPPSRELATQLSVSRNTINTAYEMLRAEGYILSRPGSGNFINPQLPDARLAPTSTLHQKNLPRQAIPFSKRGKLLARPTRPVPTTRNPAFQPGLPDLDAFPFQHWQRCVNHSLKVADRSVFKYSDQGGYQPLKLALRHYLAQSRGVRCAVEQIIIVNGSQAGLDLITRLLIDEGHWVAVEDPGYLGARDSFLAAGAQLQPIAVDGEGLVVEQLQRNRKAIRLVYTTPSYQFPLGMTMSLQRRLALLDWATSRGAFVIEDDYDSEFRYRERPLLSLQGLDETQRVVYFGTFSKVMFPGLRLGYIVAPANLADHFSKALRKTGQDAPLQLQAALTEFIDKGFFTSHIRRMRTLYAEKQQYFVELLQDHLGNWLKAEATDAGMQIPVYYRRKINETKLRQLAGKTDLVIAPLGQYHLSANKNKGLYLGYAGVPIAAMKKNVLRLKKLFDQL